MNTLEILHFKKVVFAAQYIILLNKQKFRGAYYSRLIEKRI